MCIWRDYTWSNEFSSFIKCPDIRCVWIVESVENFGFWFFLQKNESDWTDIKFWKPKTWFVQFGF